MPLYPYHTKPPRRAFWISEKELPSICSCPILQNLPSHSVWLLPLRHCLLCFISQIIVNMGRDDVLFDIFNTLHRLETLLEGQESRLKSVELSVRPSTGSAASECSCSFDSDTAASCAKGKHGSSLPPASPLTPPPSSKSAFPTPEMYQMSVMNLRNRFEFIDDSQCDVREIIQNSPQARLEPEEHDSYVGGHDDAYTQSVYSSRPLSRYDLYAPPVPAVPVPARDEAAQSSEDQSYGAPLPRDRAQNEKEPLPAAESPTNSRRSSSWRSGTSRSSRSSKSSSSRPSHQRVGMTYYACDNFVQSICASKSFRSEEKRAIRSEVRRLGYLSSPSIWHDGSPHQVQGKGSWTLELRRVFLELLGRIGLRRLGAVNYIA